LIDVAFDSVGRADVLLAEKLGVTRSFARRLIDEGNVSWARGTGTVVPALKPSRAVGPGDVFSVLMPPVEALELEPEDVPFDVVYEDDFLLVVNKPAGLVVHPSPGHWRGTLVHGLLFRYPDMGPFNNVARPGIVHRLDAGTSGLMIVARRQEVLEALQRDFRDRRIEKKYLALVSGRFSNVTGVLEGPIGRHPTNRLKMAVSDDGRDAATAYRVLWEKAGASLVACGLLTGRTHQIRVHMAAAGHPIVGDTLYGGAPSPRVFLHSWRLSFVHPATGEAVRCVCPLPEELSAILRRINSGPADPAAVPSS
jgi:23S rRNA pseudouridine1911/1915/1917 synthase